MKKFIEKFIYFLLIFNLLFVRGDFVLLTYAQEIPPTSAPLPTIPPSGPKPTSEPKPTIPPQPTIALVLVTSTPKPTSSPSPTTLPLVSTPTAGLTPSSPISSGISQNESNSTANEENQEVPLNGTSISGGESQNSNTTGSVNDPANVNTGAGSTNNAQETLEQKMEILNKNLAELQNKIDAITNTGFNYANFNTLEGKVFSGEALATLNLLNKLNSNMTGMGNFFVFDIYDTKLGDIVFKFAENQDSFTVASANVAKNSITGPFSTNEAIADNSFIVREAFGNDAKIENEINLQAISGNNTASYNTGNGTIETGNATVLGNIINLVNTNLNVSKWLFGVVNIFGHLAGNIILPKEETKNNSTLPASEVLVTNENTGAFSTNSATLDVKESTNTTMENTAEIVNTLNVSANSGNNIASANTGGGFVQSGTVQTSISNSTIANSNTIEEEGTVWMVIVNKMGKWVGQIIGAPWGSTAASNSLPIFQNQGGSGSQSYSILSENQGTGAFSNNNSDQSTILETTTVMENTASVINDITANADTGNNIAEYNTGAGTIETGDAKVGLNLVNMVNTNVVAKKFVAILVNVLGEFLGNVITPEGQNQEETVLTRSNYSENGTVENNFSSTPLLPPSLVVSTTNNTNNSERIGNIEASSLLNYPQLSEQNFSPPSFTSYVNFETSDYNQKVLAVNQVKQKISTQAKILKGGNNQLLINQQIGQIKRGVFLSPAFAKAVEGSFPGILLSGATFKIDNSWLRILPFTLFFVFWRRRKKINFSAYFYKILEILL